MTRIAGARVRVLAYVAGMLSAVAVGAAIAGHSALSGLLGGSASSAPSISSPSHAAIGCSAPANPIQRENCRFGTTAWELSQPADGQQIMGYAWKSSTAAGETLRFSVSTTAPSFDAAIYRMGWYQGDGGRLMLSRVDLPGHAYPVPKPAQSTGLIACRWPATFHVSIPSSWVSGVYLVELTASTGYQSYIPFVVRDIRPSRYLFVHAVNTDEAYNTWGGKSLYQDTRVPKQEAYANRAIAVSFDRPFEESYGAGNFLYWEYPMIRWLEKNGYDVGYATDVDIHEHRRLLVGHRAILIVGHDEYWSKQMRDAYDGAVANGISLGNFAADTAYWQIRYQASPVTGPDRMIVCYKYPDGADPYVHVDRSLVTARWRNPIIGRPESLLFGAMYNSIEDATESAAFVATRMGLSLLGSKHGLFKNLHVPGLVGYEFDSVVPGYPVPPHLQVLSTSPVTDYEGHHGVANSTIYRATSDAYVFDAGTIQWSWGLDDYAPLWAPRPPGPTWPSPSVERITTTLLALLSGG